MSTTGITLSEFEWVAAVAAAGLLISIISYLLVLLIKDMRERIAIEKAERGEADNKLAETLKEVSEAMQKINLDNTQAHGGLAVRAEVETSHRRIYEKLGEIRDSQARIESTMVTKDECLERARCPA